MNSNDIAAMVCRSHVPSGTDGLTNHERFYFICAVFQVTGVRLAEKFDFELAIQSGDIEKLKAAQFLAHLQSEWSTRCHMEGLITEDEHQVDLAYLGVSMAKMRWTYSFLAHGRDEAPPYPFMN